MSAGARRRGAPGTAALRAALIAAAGVFGCATACAQAALEPAAAIAGVDNPQRAWQHWTLNCQGCHRPDGHGSPGAAPDIAGSVAKFLRVDGGREYLARVPGVATSPLSSSDLAEVLNWMLWRFDPGDMPTEFRPYTDEELGRLRTQPLRNEAAQVRSALLKRIARSGAK